jgi:hypothetical protein
VGETASDSFTYVVRDTSGATATASVTITITGVNDDPVVVDDTLTASAGRPLLFTGLQLLANDVDVDGGVLSIASVTQPLIGSVTDNGDGTYTYVASVGFSGSDSFVVTVSDGQGGTSASRVAMSVTATAQAISKRFFLASTFSTGYADVPSSWSALGQVGSPLGIQQVAENPAALPDGVRGGFLFAPSPIRSVVESVPQAQSIESRLPGDVHSQTQAEPATGNLFPSDPFGRWSVWLWSRSQDRTDPVPWGNRALRAVDVEALYHGVEFHGLGWPEVGA